MLSAYSHSHRTLGRTGLRPATVEASLLTAGTLILMLLAVLLILLAAASIRPM
jgi:hypothetical protein